MISIGILTVRGEQYHPTRRLAEAAVARNAAVIPIHPYQVLPAYHEGKPILHGDPAASEVKAVLPRQGAEIKTACLPLIEHYAQMGVRVVNGQRSILMARNKFFMLQAMMRYDLAVPDTIFAASLEGCGQRTLCTGTGCAKTHQRPAGSRPPLSDAGYAYSG